MKFWVLIIACKAFLFAALIPKSALAKVDFSQFSDATITSSTDDDIFLPSNYYSYINHIYLLNFRHRLFHYLNYKGNYISLPFENAKF